jgi:hypothetical protein
MIGVPLLQRSQLRAECDECAARFDPEAGGFCPRCERLLCERHFHGSRWQRVWRTITGETRCRACAGEAPPD